MFTFDFVGESHGLPREFEAQSARLSVYILCRDGSLKVWTGQDSDFWCASGRGRDPETTF